MSAFDFTDASLLSALEASGALRLPNMLRLRATSRALRHSSQLRRMVVHERWAEMMRIMQQQDAFTSSLVHGVMLSVFEMADARVASRRNDGSNEDVSTWDRQTRRRAIKDFFERVEMFRYMTCEKLVHSIQQAMQHGEVPEDLAQKLGEDVSVESSWAALLIWCIPHTSRERRRDHILSQLDRVSRQQWVTLSAHSVWEPVSVLWPWWFLFTCRILLLWSEYWDELD